ncbi:unknown [[Mannheimia] succiniciproducens MBEL55E]|uniref:Uncharacterized protein n=1 Tax=Mannheimia succiniciproducens (strain KCTC 0769BP / MBEL55E) TaxID=221988 RepID=Q65QC0_MANSM|nr:unknown [[Mannheimia] succiniciproducens MBEL55E]
MGFSARIKICIKGNLSVSFPTMLVSYQTFFSYILGLFYATNSNF